MSTYKQALKIGDRVVALEEISEVLPDGKKLFHARVGSIGQVVGMYPEAWPTIRWDSGTACDCVPDEEFLIQGES